jgi:hypothetical protein
MHSNVTEERLPQTELCETLVGIYTNMGRRFRYFNAAGVSLFGVSGSTKADFRIRFSSGTMQ